LAQQDQGADWGVLDAISMRPMQAGWTDAHLERSLTMVANLIPPSGVRTSAPRTQDRVVPRRQIGLWATMAFAALSAIGMFVQVYLIAGVLFGEAWLELHSDLGKLVHLGYLLTFVAALVVAATDWRWLLWPFVLAALGSTQAFLAGEFDLPLVAWGIDLAGGNGALHALHGALVPIVFVTALVIARQAWTALKVGARTQAPALAGELARSGLAADPKLFASLAAVAFAGPALAIAVLAGSYLVGGQ
jgi:hypothetical protein